MKLSPRQRRHASPRVAPPHYATQLGERTHLVMMTRDEHRAKCIKAMAIAWIRGRVYYKNLVEIPDWLMRQTIEEQTVTFDSLHGIAWVVTGPFQSSIIVEVLDASDLTNQPEQKP
jgi:hypothetical protein